MPRKQVEDDVDDRAQLLFKLLVERYLADGSPVASKKLAAFPEVEDGRRRYLASNAVGDAVLLYSAVQGPLWDLAQRRLS